MKRLLLLTAITLFSPTLLLAQDSFRFQNTTSASGAKKGTVNLEVPAGELLVKAESA